MIFWDVLGFTTGTTFPTRVMTPFRNQWPKRQVPDSGRGETCGDRDLAMKSILIINKLLCSDMIRLDTNTD